MGSSLKSLIVALSLFYGIVTTPTAHGYGKHDTVETTTFPEIPHPKAKFGFFTGHPFGYPFAAHQNQQPENMNGNGDAFAQAEPVTEPVVEPQAEIESASLGSWEIHSENAGVSAMHIQLMPNNKVVWHDSTSNGLSELENNPPFCRPRVGGRKDDPKQDCTAHALEYDVDTARVRPLKVDSSPWCSSGGLSRSGNLISTGGDKDGLKSVRILKPCATCDFEENERALFANRWYATQHALEDGSFVLIGGRNSYNYEIVPPDTIQFTPQLFELPLLEESNDDAGRENNLYPFVNLLPDGNLFVFANYKSIILNPRTGETVRRLPDLPGGSRNYPPSGMSALLSIDLSTNNELLNIEVIVCGGNTRDSYIYSDLQQPKRTFMKAAKDCGRLKLNVEDAEWEKEDMPSPRVMGDMLLLPTGDVLILSGAKEGTSAWDAANDPNLTPVLYSPNKENGYRFKELAPSTIPRMYHSSSAVLPDGKVLVAGSNTNAYYKLEKYGDQFTFPSELRVEKFSPPYLAPELDNYRLAILEGQSEKEWKYGGEFNVAVRAGLDIQQNEIKVTMYSPPFTTHGYSMNQRLLILKVTNVQNGRITVVAPPSARLAPMGYYLVFVVHRGVPSRGMWVNIQQET